MENEKSKINIDLIDVVKIRAQRIVIFCFFGNWKLLIQK